MVESHYEEIKAMGNALLEDKNKWAKVPSIYSSLFNLGVLLAQMGNIEVPVGSDITIVCSADDADTIAAGFLEKIEERFPHSKVNLICTWTSPVDNAESTVGIITPIQKIYSEPYNQDNNVFFTITSGYNEEEYSILKTNITRVLNNNENPIYVVGPITQPKLNDKLITEFPARLEFKFISFKELNKPLIGNEKESNIPWYFAAISNHIDDGISCSQVPMFVKERREKIYKN